MKNNENRKLLAGILVLSTAFMLNATGCGNNNAQQPAADTAKTEAAPAESTTQTENTAAEASAEPAQAEDGVYKSADGWSVRYDASCIAVNEIDEHTTSFVYVGESAGTNMVTISYVQGKMPNEAMSEITESWEAEQVRTEGYFPGDPTKWGYWRTLKSDGTGSDNEETVIGGEYNGGSLVFDVISHIGNNDELGMEAGGAIEGVIDSITYENFEPQTELAYYPGTYSRTDADSGAVYSVVLNEDHTGKLSFQDDVDIFWTSTQLMTDDASYEFTIEGNMLYMDSDGIWLEFTKDEA